jgi:hypothetical protein
LWTLDVSWWEIKGVKRGVFEELEGRESDRFGVWECGRWRWKGIVRDVFE